MAPVDALKRPFHEQIRPVWNLTKFHIKCPKCAPPFVTTQLEHNLTFGTKSGQFGPSDAIKTCRGAKVPFTGYYSLCHDFPYIVEAHVHYGIIAL